MSNKDKENGLDQEEDLLDEQLDESHEKPVEEEAELSLEQQVDDLKDQLLRAQAEVQNVRRVAGQEITKARLYGVEFLAREFLVVGDNLQKALESCNEKAEIDSKVPSSLRPKTSAPCPPIECPMIEIFFTPKSFFKRDTRSLEI